jgi:ribosomal protein S13
MVRLLGNNLSNKKKIYISLTAIYGIGISRSLDILNRLNFVILIYIEGLIPSSI